MVTYMKFLNTNPGTAYGGRMEQGTSDHRKAKFGVRYARGFFKIRQSF